MKRYPIYRPQNNNVCSSSTYIVNHIIPICIKERDDQMFSVLFLVQNDTQDEEIKDYLGMFFSYDNERDKEFIKNHQLNYNNIVKNPKQLKMYIEMTSGISQDTLYSTDLDLTVYEEKKMFYHCYGYSQSSKDGQIKERKILLNRSLFVQINLFFMRFVNLDSTAETVFFDMTLNKIEFVSLQTIKLDSSAKPAPTSQYITNHYTGRLGPNYYKFHFISPSIFGRRLRNPMGYEQYCTLYSKDTLVDQMFMDFKTNTLFIIYIEKSPIDGKYKRTLALKLSEELYNHTNFLDIYKIYEEVKEK